MTDTNDLNDKVQEMLKQNPSINVVISVLTLFLSILCSVVLGVNFLHRVEQNIKDSLAEQKAVIASLAQRNTDLERRIGVVEGEVHNIEQSRFSRRDGEVLAKMLRQEIKLTCLSKK